MKLMHKYHLNFVKNIYKDESNPVALHDHIHNETIFVMSEISFY